MVTVKAEDDKRSQSSILREALDEWFKLNPIDKPKDSIQCEK